MEGGLGSPAGRSFAPLYGSYWQPLAFTVWSDASSDAMGGIFFGSEHGSGVWLRFEFDADVHERTTVKSWNEPSINVPELLGIWR